VIPKKVVSLATSKKRTERKKESRIGETAFPRNIAPKAGEYDWKVSNYILVTILR